MSIWSTQSPHIVCTAKTVLECPLCLFLLTPSHWAQALETEESQGGSQGQDSLHAPGMPARPETCVSCLPQRQQGPLALQSCVKIGVTQTSEPG